MTREAAPAEEHPTPPPPPRSLTAHFQTHEPARQGPAWDALWRAGRTPWDRGGPCAALRDLLLPQEGRSDLFPGHPSGAQQVGKAGKRKTALVPGCGRGYDVLQLAELGYDVVGLEISDTAIRAAREHAAAAASGGREAGEEEEEGGESEDARGAVVWAAGDFFEDDWLRGPEVQRLVGGGGGGGKFDLIFDHTVRRLTAIAFPPARPLTLIPNFGLFVCPQKLTHPPSSFRRYIRTCDPAGPRGTGTC